MKYMKYLWMSACALLLATVTACSDYEIFAEDLNPAKVTDDDSGDSEEEDNWDGTFEEGAVLPFTRTNRAVTASFTTVFQSNDVKAIEKQGVLVSWRWLPGDADDITFDVYRDGTKLNAEPISKSTNYKDLTAVIGTTYTYTVKNAVSGESLGTCTITPTSGAAGFYRSVKVKVRADYDINDGAIGDLDGDGEYEIVIKRQVIGQSRDVGQSNSEVWTGVQRGSCILEAYKLDGSSNGEPMWTIDMGKNINQGAHTTQFLVYDFDGDGKAEVAFRSAEGTTFGDGTTIGDVNGDGKTDYRNQSTGRVLDGPEFLSLADGETGAEMARTEYIPRGTEDTWLSYWGDTYGGRSERFLMGVAHLGSQDGRASIIICRGYYVNFQIWAMHYNTEDGKLRNRWKFNTANGYAITQWLGQGFHNLSCGDVDDDGKDEITYGSCAIDDNGKGLYTTGLGHGDALHLGKFDPNRSGLQVVACHEDQNKHGGKAIEYRDAATGQIISYISGNGDVGRCMVADIDPENPGC
ncbi:rhamnogalacturonan lyase, partial [Bacteroides finegoldii]